MKNSLLSSSSKLVALFSLVAVTGCAKYHSWVLDSTPEPTAPFNCALYKEYKCLGDIEENNMYDECSADFYYRKAICAKENKNVIPTTPEKWDIEEDRLPELQAARCRLLAALDAGGRQVAPCEAADAQASFDCWVEQQSEGWQMDDIARCRTSYYSAIAEVELKLMGGVLSVAPAQMIFFDFNSSHINTGNHSAIEAVAAMSKGSKKHILLIGRTDKIGDARHNEHLSKFRALAVKKELVRRGIAPHLITIKAAGETPGPNLDTHNRRVDVVFLDVK
jgi:OOP family OmpA-OmpF porin